MQSYYSYAVCRWAECHYVVCHGSGLIGPNIPSILTLTILTFSIPKPSIIDLIVSFFIKKLSLMTLRIVRVII
jgi:hypothetical protein